MTTFQIVIIAIFVVLGVGAVLVFTGVIPGIKPPGQPDESVKLTVWGTVSAKTFNLAIKDFKIAENDFYEITYREKNPEKIEVDLLRSIADGSSPDLILFPENLLVTLEDRLFPIPEESFSNRKFKETFLEASEIFLSSQGTYALPLLVDPLVLYWNRTLYTNENLISAPLTWTEFLESSQKLTKRDNRGVISQSAIALGTTKNVNHYKDIISAMILQSGGDIIDRNSKGETVSDLGNRTNTLSPGETALLFYADFSNPQLRHYSWNNSLPKSIDAFSSETLATYIGPASDLSLLKNKNPHINLDSAILPQIAGGGRRVTEAHVLGIGISKNSKNINSAFTVAFLLTTKYAKSFSDNFLVAPARKDLLKVGNTDPFLDTFYNSALISKSWLDPNDSKTDDIFDEMITSVTSGRKVPGRAVDDAKVQLESLFR